MYRLIAHFYWPSSNDRQIRWRLVCICLVGLGLYCYGQNRSIALAKPAVSVAQQTIPPTAPTQWLPLVFRDYHAATVTSPNGNLRLHFFFNTGSPAAPLSYTLTAGEQSILRNSALGLELSAAETPLAQLAMTKLTFTAVD